MRATSCSRVRAGSAKKRRNASSKFASAPRPLVTFVIVAPSRSSGSIASITCSGPKKFVAIVSAVPVRP